MNNKDLNKPGITLIGLSLAGILSPVISRLISNQEGAIPWLFDLAANWQGLYVVLLLIGVIISWISRYVGVPVDQVLISDHWGVLNYQVGTDIGSDHLPVIATISLYE